MSKPDPEKLSCLFDDIEQQDAKDVGLETELEHKTYRWRDVYVERGELGLLMERWKKVSDFQRVEEIQPQLAILLANSGFGKTRLVHKFYEEIVKRHQTGGCRYWPPFIGRNNDTLTVNPPFDQVDLEQRLPFLWWGVQLPDQTTEKSTCKPVLNDSVRVLSSHLFSMEMARQKKEVRNEIGQEVLNLALVTISKLTLIETAKDYYEIGKGIAGAINKAIGIRKEEKQSHTERARKEKKEFVDEVVENLSMLMNPDNSDMERIPMVLFIDDAQWIVCKQDNKSRPNTDLLELLGKIMRLARQEHWPIMIILTHWEEDWNKLRLSGDGVPYLLESGDKAEIIEPYARTINPNYHGWEEWERSIIRLGQFDLSGILKAALPGVYRDEGQRMRLIGKVVDGFQREKEVLADNARYLDEFLKMLYQPANLEYLRDRSIDQPLIDGWEERMSRKLGGLEYARLVQNRFDQLKEPYRQTLCLSSYQGIEFPEKLTEVISRYLYGPKYDCPWSALEDPETFIQRNVKYPSGVSRFPDSVYKSIAYEALSPEHKQKLKEILPRLLSHWLYYGSFAQGLEALDLNFVEEETLCEIALKVLDDCRSDSESLTREIDADLASVVALSRLVRINRYKYNEQQAYRYALEFYESLVEPWDPGDIEFGDAIAIYNSLSLHQQHSAAIFIARNINSDCIELDRLNDDQKSKSNLSLSYGLLGGVAFDMQQPNEARAWHEKALEIDRLLAEQSPDPKTLHSLSITFERLGDIAADMLRLDEAKRWYEQSLTIRSQLAEQSSSRQDLRDLSFAYGKLGGLALELLQLEEADSFHQKALEIREQLLQGHENPDTLRDLSLSLERLGDVAVAMNDFEKAQQFFHDMLDIKEVLVEEAVTPQTLRDLAIANKKLGRVALNMQQPDAAKAWYEKALEIDHLLTEKYPGPKTLLDLSITYLDLGDVVLDNQQPEDASAWYEQSLDILSKLAKSSLSPKVLSNQAIACERLGNVASNMQQQEAAKVWYEQALEIRRQQSEDAKNPQTLRNLSIMYGKLGDVARTVQQLEGAKAWYEQALEICHQLAENSSSPQALRDLSIMYEKLGYVAGDMQQPEGAKIRYEQSLEIRRQLAEKSSSPQTLRDLSTIYECLGDVAGDMQHLDDAKSWYEQSLEIRRQLAENSSSPQTLRDLSVLYEKLGNVAGDMQQPEGAKDWYEQSLEIRRQLAENFSSPQTLRGLSVLYEKLGNVAGDMQQPEGAKDWYEQSLEIRRQLAENSSSPQTLRGLSVLYQKLGNVASDMLQPEGAKTWYEQSLEIRRQLAENSQSPQTLGDLSTIYECLGNVAGDMQHLDDAKAWYEQSLEICHELAEHSSSPETLRGLFVAYVKLGEVDFGMQQLEAAKVWYEQALKTTDLLMKNSSSPQTLRDHAFSCGKLGEVAEKLQQPEVAVGWHEQALELHRKILATSNSLQGLRDISLSIERLGIAALTMGNLAKARELFTEMMNTKEQLVEMAASPQALRDLYISYSKMGDVARETEQPAEARDWYKKALDVCIQVGSQSTNIQSYYDLFYIQLVSGDIASDMQNLEEARNWYIKAVQTSEELIGDAANTSHLQLVAIPYEYIGDICSQNDEHHDAGKWFGKALAILLHLREQSHGDALDLCRLYEKSGTNEVQLGEMETALDWYTQGLSLIESEEGHERYELVREDLQSKVSNLSSAVEKLSQSTWLDLAIGIIKNVAAGAGMEASGEEQRQQLTQLQAMSMEIYSRWEAANDSRDDMDMGLLQHSADILRDIAEVFSHAGTGQDNDIIGLYLIAGEIANKLETDPYAIMDFAEDEEV